MGINQMIDPGINLVLDPEINRRAFIDFMAAPSTW
jgi:hypothetical protein